LAQYVEFTFASPTEHIDHQIAVAVDERARLSRHVKRMKNKRAPAALV
jgi:hypothetical protein